MTETPTTDGIYTVLLAAAALADEAHAVGGLVVIHFDPVEAAVAATGEDGLAVLLHRDNDAVPAALREAAIAVMAEGLSRLDPAAARTVCRLEHEGTAQLRLVVDLDQATATGRAVPAGAPLDAPGVQLFRGALAPETVFH